MRHNKPRFRLKAKNDRLRRRRKAVEFMAGLSSSVPFSFRKRNPIEPKR